MWKLVWSPYTIFALRITPKIEIRVLFLFLEGKELEVLLVEVEPC